MVLIYFFSDGGSGYLLFACVTPVNRHNRVRHGEQKIAQFRTHYLTKEVAYVSTQQSGYFPTDTEMI